MVRGVLRFLSSCGMWGFSSLVVVPGSRVRGLCSLWHTGSLVEARELNSCGLVAPGHVGS